MRGFEKIDNGEHFMFISLVNKTTPFGLGYGVDYRALGIRKCNCGT